MSRCVNCNFDESLWDDVEDEVLARVERAVGQLHKARQALEIARRPGAALAMSDAIRGLEAAEERVELLLRSEPLE